ncbi:manganese efflux pump [candidate division WOR-3 bacterium]|nr:manganese efflux pump [candidate division WOR-3 bacterium]
MNLITIFGIGIGLSMDALAVSVINGFVIKKLKIQNAFKIAFSFGFFQALMPVIGWSAGLSFRKYIQSFDHWIAFSLLCLVGGKMIYESIKCSEEKKDCLQFPALLMLSIATSIDALAVGLSFSFLQVEIIFPALIIGVVTFIICLIGIYVGDKIGKFIGNKLGLIGGLILIIIGIKIVIEHTAY